MLIIKMTRQWTKCRIVYLSNLAEKKGSNLSISHNTAMLSGPCLNRNVLTTLTQMRCEKFLLIFDLVKAFLQIKVPAADMTKLCFLWFKNVRKADFSLVAYQFNRLPFGLKCSPFILMISLYHILIVDTDSDCDSLRELKKNIWNLFYVDNGAIISSDPNYLNWAHGQLSNIFGKYHFKVQQFVSNYETLQQSIAPLETQVPVKLLGTVWDVERDTLCMEEIHQ